MAVHDVTTRNVALPPRKWTRPYAITLSDTVTEKNLQLNGIPFKYLQNVGTAGLVVIAWESDAAEVSIWVGQGEIIEGGLWRHAKTTGTTAGVDLRGLVGINHRGTV